MKEGVFINIIDKLKKDTNNADDIIYKNIKINNEKIILIYSEVLTDSESINNILLKNLSQIINSNIKVKNLYKYLINIVPSNNIKKIKEYDDLINKLLNGYVILISKKYIFAMEYKQNLNRGINEAKSEIAIRGPKDSFNENFNTNLGLIRKRIKSEDLWYEHMDIGLITKTKVAILYMNNITDISLVNKVKKSLKKINIDAIIDSGYIKNMITENSLVFPTVITTERPDLASMSLLEGKIIILVDNSPYALILPTFFIDLFHTPDDYYQKNLNISFIRIIRLIAFFISIFLPAYYISITTHNHDSVSLQMLLNFISQRKTVPFPAIVESLLMTISFEILRESDMRMASTMGSAVSILGGLILGDALVNAGIVSPIMIIVVAISAISGLLFTSIELTNTIRFYRILLMFLGAFLGIYGLILGLFFLFIKLASTEIYDYSYMAPFSPFVKTEQRDAFLKFKSKGTKLRNKTLVKNNLKRGN